MILKINFSKEDVLRMTEGQVILRVKRYAKFAQVAHLATVDGSTIEDFDDKKVRKEKYLYVGTKGGISL